MGEQKLHATYGASSAHRWLACPGSVQLSQWADPPEESEYAREGTEAHECLERFLKCDPSTWNGLSWLLNDEGHELEAIDHARDAADVIQTIKNGIAYSKLFCETKVDLSFVKPGEFGTVDAAITDVIGESLTIIDFKYGKGIPVDPKENEQLLYYALGLAHRYEYRFEIVTLMIIQPRAKHPSGETTRSWTLSMEELRSWEQKFRDGIKKCEEPSPPLVSGTHCRFCPARKALCNVVDENELKKANRRMYASHNNGNGAHDFPDDDDTRSSPQSQPPAAFVWKETIKPVKKRKAVSPKKKRIAKAVKKKTIVTKKLIKKKLITKKKGKTNGKRKNGPKTKNRSHTKI